VVKVFQNKRNIIKTWVKALRVHQWSKNMLIFVPLIMSHKIQDPSRLASSLIAFASFSLCASAIYLLNDLLDLESDRSHPKKKYRPLASGELPIQSGIFLASALLTSSIVLSSFLGRQFLALLVLYTLLNCAYSLYLKRRVMVDVILLAVLYVIRIFAGAAAVEVLVSSWLMAFAMFFFLSLALMKRYAELYLYNRFSKESPKGRGYVCEDMQHIATMGASSGYISVLVMALYINSKEVVALYSRPEVLWLIAPLLLYWISRVWLLTQRGKMRSDPIIFAMKDKSSYGVGFLIAIIILCAI